MRQKLFTFLLICSFLCIGSYFIMADGDHGGTLTMRGITKMYIEYENGQYQVIEFPSIDYSYHASDGTTDSTGSIRTICTSELTENSNISKIALWMDSLYDVPDDPEEQPKSFPINGFLAVNRNAESAIGVSTATPITQWASGSIVFGDGDPDFSGFSDGVTNFNSNISATGQGQQTILTISPKLPFDAKNKNINIQFKGITSILGTVIQSSNL